MQPRKFASHLGAHAGHVDIADGPLDGRRHEGQCAIGDGLGAGLPDERQRFAGSAHVDLLGREGFPQQFAHGLEIGLDGYVVGGPLAGFGPNEERRLAESLGLKQDLLAASHYCIDDFGTAGGHTGNAARAIDGHAAADLEEEFWRLSCGGSCEGED